MITLKEHNVKPYAQLCEMLAVHQKCAYIAATGTGKSYVVGKYIEDHDLVDKTLVLVPSKAIRDNWLSLIPGISTITYQSGCNGFDTSDIELIVCDEMHHLGAKQWGGGYEESTVGFEGKMIGTTATPIRFLDNGRNMADEFFNGNVVEGLDLPGAITEGILPTFDYITALYDLPSRIPSADKKNKMTDRLFSKLDFMKSEYSFKNILRKHLSDDKHKIAVFGSRIESIQKLRELCEDVFPEASHYVIHSLQKEDEVENTVWSFKNDSGLAFIYTVDMFNEGVHIEGIDTVIMFRKTVSPTIYLQQLGRALSSDMANQRVKIFDFVANHNNLRSAKSGSDSVVQWIKKGIRNSARQIVISDYALEEIEVLEKLQKTITGYSHWSEEEDALLKEKYDCGKGVAELKKLLPNRSKSALYARALAMGITGDGSKYDYSEEFVNDLREHYCERDGVDYLVAKYPQYSKELIRQRAAKLGLKREPKFPLWTKEEDEILRNNASESTEKLMELLPGRSKKSIISHKMKIGASVSKRKWTPEKDEILKNNWELTASEIKRRFFPDADVKSINARLAKLGLPQRGNFYSEDQERLLIETYERGGVAAVLELPEFADRSPAAIYTKVSKMGLKSPNRQNFWSEQDIKIIEEYLDIPENERPASRTLADKLPNHTWSSIKQKKTMLSKKRKEAEANGTDTETTGAADPADTKAEA